MPKTIEMHTEHGATLSDGTPVIIVTNENGFVLSMNGIEFQTPKRQIELGIKPDTNKQRPKV